jgi:hypothetical protein
MLVGGTKTLVRLVYESFICKSSSFKLTFTKIFVRLGKLRILYYFDQVFTILGKKWAEMADKFSFDLRRIKKKKVFFSL